MTDEPLTLRPETGDDLTFLRQLYASSRADEFAPLGMHGDQLDALLAAQFDAQRSQYRATHPDADYLIVTLAGERIGRLYTGHAGDDIVLIDIMLADQFRRHGHGTTLIQRVLDRSDADQHAVVLTVRKDNPAFSLYQRLGFEVVDDSGVAWRMRRHPGTHH